MTAADAPLTDTEADLLRETWTLPNGQMGAPAPGDVFLAVESILLARETALRETIAQEIEKQGRAVVEWLAQHKGDNDLDMGRLIGTEDAYKNAIRIARDEKYGLDDLAGQA